MCRKFILLIHIEFLFAGMVLIINILQFDWWCQRRALTLISAPCNMYIISCCIPNGDDIPNLRWIWIYLLQKDPMKMIEEIMDSQGSECLISWHLCSSLIVIGFSTSAYEFHGLQCLFLLYNCCLENPFDSWISFMIYPDTTHLGY